MTDAQQKALRLLGLARRARLLQIGEEPVGIACRSGKARLLLVARDAGDHTFRRARSFVSGSKCPYVCVPFTKDELGDDEQGIQHKGGIPQVHAPDPGAAIGQGQDGGHPQPRLGVQGQPHGQHQHSHGIDAPAAQRLSLCSCTLCFFSQYKAQVLSAFSRSKPRYLVP